MRNLFAAFKVKTGQRLVGSIPSRAIPWVFSFLDQILQWVRRGPIVIITANISTRTGDAARRWLPSTCRSDCSSPPKHGSCLNQVEIWFSILTGKALRSRSFNSLRALDDALYGFAEYWNRELAHPLK